MFHPVGHPLERGWVGRVDGDRVVHLAAQTLQSFFTGGGTAREHAEYALAECVLLAPVLHPPSVRIFDEQGSFAFANPAAIVGPRAVISHSRSLTAHVRPAAVIGAGGEIGGFTALIEWRAHGLAMPKDRDFALGLGPVVVTPDTLTPPDFDWAAAVALACDRTMLYAGDVIAAPVVEMRKAEPDTIVAFEVAGVGILEQRIGAR
jgi:hypothetical protein